MAEITYSIRSRMIEKEKHFRLTPDALVWTSGGKEERIAYTDVARINLMVGQSQYGMAANCAIWPKTGKRLIFGTVHFASAVSYENRAAGYGPFVRALLARIADAAPDAEYTRGSPLDYLLLKIGLFMLSGLGVAVVLLGAVARLAVEPVFLGLFGFIAVMIPVTYRLMQSRKPTPIDPRSPPAELTGDTGSESETGIMRVAE